MTSFLATLNQSYPQVIRCLGAFLPKTLCLLSGLRGKMAERELLFQRSMRGPLASAAINKKWVTDSSAEQTLEEKPRFRAHLHLLRAYCVSVVVTKP